MKDITITDVLSRAYGMAVASYKLEEIIQIAALMKQFGITKLKVLK